MNSNVERFLTASQEQRIVAAIREAETQTSGEIRVHIEASFGHNIDERTQAVFTKLKMHETALRNGVLIYVAVNDKAFSIYGDKGINAVVAKHFWDTTRDAIQLQFKKGYFTQGLINGIQTAGQELKIHFPCQTDDVNELPNTISKG